MSDNAAKIVFLLQKPLRTVLFCCSSLLSEWYLYGYTYNCFLFSKIERGKGLTIKTVTKVLDALGMSASVVLKGEQEIDKNVIAYIVAAISEFAEIHHLSDFYFHKGSCSQL